MLWTPYKNGAWHKLSQEMTLESDATSTGGQAGTILATDGLPTRSRLSEDSLRDTRASREPL
jgi:hypothetical protein